MASLFEIMPGIEPDENELLQAELLAIQILQAKYPDLDLRTGTGLKDLVIRPAATLLAMINKGQQFLALQNNVSEVDDETPTALVDKMLSNWFIDRNTGTNAVVSARLYFAQRKNVYLTTSTFFSTDNVKKFYPAATYSFTASQLQFDAYSSEFYVDVQLVADTPGSDYNLQSGSLLYFSNFDPYFLRGEINYLEQSADDPETNTQFISRTSSAISTRNLINIPSADFLLKEKFSFIDDLVSIGFGDPQMQRDSVEVLGPSLDSRVRIHVGGKMDFYCRTDLASSIVQVMTDANGQALLTGPIYQVFRSPVSGGSDADTLPLTVQTTPNTLTYTSITDTVNVLQAGHGLSNGDAVIISGADQPEYNGVMSVTIIDANNYQYTPLTAPSVSPATGTIQAALPIKFLTTFDSIATKTITGLSKTSDVVQATINNHNLVNGTRVQIVGSNIVGYDGWYTVIESVSEDVVKLRAKNATVLASTAIPCQLYYVDPAEDVGFSTRQTLLIDFGSSYPNMSVSFLIRYFNGIDSIQTYLNDPSSRVLSADPLARGLNSYLLSFTVTSYTNVVPDSKLCQDTITAYLKSLGPGEPFIMADLLSNLYNAGVNTIQTPVGVTYKYFSRDHGEVLTGTITDALNPNDPTAVFYFDSVITGTASV